jgi:hypothetical protein
MSINTTIQAWQAAQIVLSTVESLPNSQYDLSQHYAAIVCVNLWLNRMINHKDWSVELQDRHYIQSPGAIAYPTSC